MSTLLLVYGEVGQRAAGPDRTALRITLHEHAAVQALVRAVAGGAVARALLACHDRGEEG